VHGRFRWPIAGAVLLAVLATAASVAIASEAPRGFGHLPTGVPPAGGPPYDGSLTSVVSPSPGGLVTGARLAVILRSRAPARAIQVRLNGHELAGGLSAAGGRYTGSASLGGPLHLGGNLITVSTSWGGHFDFDVARFVVARRVGGLATVQRLLVHGSDAPVTVSARVARNASFRASVNGHDVRSAFTRTGDELVGLLGANDGVRHGSNRLLVTANTSSSGDAAATTISRRFDLPRDAPIASAGHDRTVLAGQFVSLKGAQSLLAAGDAGRAFAWRLARAPRGSKARLLGAAQVSPGFVADRPGTYRIRLTLSAKAPQSAGRKAVPTAARRSTDTVTVTVQTNEPYGIPLESNGPGGAILVDGVAQPDTTRKDNVSGISYAVIDRTTGKPAKSGQFPATADGLNQLLRMAQGYSDGKSLLVFNWTGALRDYRPVLAQVVKLVGGGDLPASDQFASNNLPGSVIGVPGAPAGSGFFNHRDLPNLPDPGAMSGYLRLNGVTGRFDFVFTRFVPVDTAPASENTRTRSTINVGGTNYSLFHPPDTSGFQVVTLDPKSLALISNRGYDTNSADGTEREGVAGLATNLQSSADLPERPLVILQSFGAPKGASGDWDRAGLAIQKLGGTRQVFADLNQPWAGGVGGDPTAGRRGGYALIGRTNGAAPPAEVSYPLDGLPARLAGLLMLTRTADYEPMLVSPVRPDGRTPVNEELVRIANQAPTPFPTLAPDASRADAQAAEDFLGGPAVMNVCQAGQTCDVRKTYYTNYNGAWQTIATELQNATTKCQLPHEGFTPALCEQVRSQLFDEVQAGNRVRHYLGPQGLQQPFGAAGVAALANLGQISQQIQDAVKPRPESDTTSQVLTVISYVVRVGALAGPQAAGVASALGAVFALAGYLTKPGNSPNLIGPEVQTTAANLGVELANRYQTAGDQLDGLGRIIVSDYGKLRAIASKVDADPNWIIGTPGAAREQLVRAAKRTISEALIPVAFPVLYDLGRVPQLNAANWVCTYNFGARRKYLFDRNPDGGQVVQRFPGNWNPVMAAGEVHARGSQNAARILGPAGTVVDPLFAPPELGGLGMQKLEFYTPSRFRLFPPNPAPGATVMSFRNPNDVPSCPAIPDPPGDSG
jgi:hypothetical protein